MTDEGDLNALRQAVRDAEVSLRKARAAATASATGWVADNARALAQDVSKVSDFPGPLDRAQALGRLADVVLDLQRGLRLARSLAVNEALADHSLAEVASVIGVSRQRVYAIRDEMRSGVDADG